MAFDKVILNGRWFDGTGGPSAVRNIGIRDGTDRGSHRGTSRGTEVVDATGSWVMPGIIDIHTHYDAEVLALQLCRSPCGMASPRSSWGHAHCQRST